jgi:3-deoxy-manno-octulosonate cytidylyltransferase (CMP-KDO synthetase)
MNKPDSSLEVIAVIPARYASTRFPGKMLAPLGGKPLVLHAWENACAASRIHHVFVATDDEGIAAVVRDAGGEVIMTPAECPSGTDRIARALGGRTCRWVVNVQGDEPFLSPGILDGWLDALGDFPMATLARPFDPDEPVEDPNRVKVVMSPAGRALYFSRSAIPFDREPSSSDGETRPYYHHLGVYAYRPETLRQLVALPPSPLEKREKLEQLRALENGIDIQVIVKSIRLLGVDTEEDLKEAEKALQA